MVRVATARPAALLRVTRKSLETLSRSSQIAGMQLDAAKRTKIHVNGEATETAATTLAHLVAELGYADGAVATALNGEFVARHARAATQLSPGDHVEIVAPRQGG
jgi:sulfur carrier protein